jgi:hypothetical protein
MNSRDLPEVVSELIIEMPEVHLEPNAPNGPVGRLEQTVAEGFRSLSGLYVKKFPKAAALQ